MSVLYPEDKTFFGSVKVPINIIYGLMQLYGYETDFFLAKIREMRNLKKPDIGEILHLYFLTNWSIKMQIVWINIKGKMHLASTINNIQLWSHF